MKIFALIHNYEKTENAESPFGAGNPTWYEMADSSVLRSGNPFFVPDFDSEFMAFPSIVYRIGRLGKSIAPRFAGRYLEAWGMAVAVVATNRLKTLKTRGMPWTPAVSFDRSCLLGNLQPIDTLINNKTFEISFKESNVIYNPADLRMPVEETVALLSADNTLKNGDLVLAGLYPDGINLTPGGTLRVRPQLDDNTNLLETNIR